MKPQGKTWWRYCVGSSTQVEEVDRANAGFVRIAVIQPDFPDYGSAPKVSNAIENCEWHCVVLR